MKVTSTPVGFGITISPATISMSASQNSIVTVTLQSNNGYADAIGLGCGTLPMGITCHFESNTVEVLVYSLRKKLGQDFIKTQRGIGYMVAA